MNKPDPSAHATHSYAASPANASTYSVDTSQLAPDFDPHAPAKIWAEWLEAGRLWMSWWMNSLPTMPWPPAGVVLPPAPQAAVRTDNPAPAPTATPAQASAHAAGQTTKHSRAASARHH
jgi:hypothetical protein